MRREFDTLVSKYANSLKLEGRLSEYGSVVACLKTFQTFVSDKPYIETVSDINRADIEDYLQYIWHVEYEADGNQYRPSFVYRRMRALNNFFEYLVIQDIDEKWLPQSGIILKSDFPSPNRRGVRHFPKWFDEYVHEKILAIPKDKSHIRERTMMLCIYHTGVRAYDLCTIELDSVFEKAGKPWMRIFSNKLKKEYEIPIVDELYEAIEEYKEIRKDVLAKRKLEAHPVKKTKVKYLFVDAGTPQSLKTSFSRKLKLNMEEFLKCAESEGHDVSSLDGLSLTTHKFRHNVAIKLTRLGADPLLVAEFLGHSNLSMAAAYIQEDNDYIDELFDELHEDEDEIEPIIIKKEELYKFGGVIQKTNAGWCTQIGNNTPCGENPYQCWNCENLHPNIEDPEYSLYLLKQKDIHLELLNRNIELGFESAANEEKKVIERINSFLEEIERT